jgi:stage II sporulation protein D
MTTPARFFALLTTCSALMFGLYAWGMPQQHVTDRKKNTPYKQSALDPSASSRPSKNPEQEAQESKIWIRVLVDKAPQAETAWLFTSQAGFMVSGLSKTSDTPNTKKYIETSDIQVRVTIKDGQPHCKLGSQHLYGSPETPLEIIPFNDKCLLDKKIYPGSFMITCHDGMAYLTNTVDLETYVYCVVRWESVPSWPEEANKAFAIVVRSYVMAKFFKEQGKTREPWRPWIIRATNKDQTYKGLPEKMFASLREVIDQTKGIVIVDTTTKKIAHDLMYDICCGGVVPAYKSGVNFNTAPHLKRTYPCTHCKPFKFYRWRLTYSKSDFAGLLSKNIGKRITRIDSVEVVKKDRSGTLCSLRIGTNKGPISLTGAQTYSAFPALKSLVCNATIKNGLVEFSGSGCGHGMGLCQWGAYYMALEELRRNKGRPCPRNNNFHKQIIRYYFPHIEFRRIRIVPEAPKLQDPEQPEANE